MGSTTLSAGQYSLTAGKLTINQGVIQTAGNHTITVSASGYLNSTVTQTVTPGAFNDANSSAISDVPYAVGATCIVTLTARDQYNNPISGYQFKYSVNIDNANPTNQESYEIDGQAYSKPSVFNGLAATNVNVASTTDTNGKVVVTVIFPAPIDALDGGGPIWENAEGNLLSHQ